MRLNEITKDQFKKELKYPMELVDGITKEIERVNERFNSERWIKVDYDQEFGDDFVAWTLELNYEMDDADPEEVNDVDRDKVYSDTIMDVYRATVRNYQWEDISLSFHELNRSKGYLLMGIQLDT